jgi:DNA polymerase-3 subunit beta
MKIVANTKEFRETLQRVYHVVNPNSPVVLLSHIKLEALESGQIILSASDYEVELECIASGAVSHPGAVTLPAKQFCEIVSHMKGDELSVESKNWSTSTVKSGKSRYTLNGLEPGSFPSMPALQDPWTITLPEDILKDMVEKTLPAIGSNDNKPALNGALLQLTPRFVKLISSDLYQFIFYRAAVDWNGDEAETVIPKATMGALTRNLQDEQKEIWVQFDENLISITTPRFRLTSRVIAGPYPNVQRVIDKIVKGGDGCGCLHVNRAELIGAVKRLAAICEDDSYRLHLKAVKGELALHSIPTDKGNGEEFLSIENDGGETLEVFLNAKQLINLLNALGGDQVSIWIGPDRSPVEIAPTETEGYYGLLAPLVPW